MMPPSKRSRLLPPHIPTRLNFASLVHSVPVLRALRRLLVAAALLTTPAAAAQDADSSSAAPPDSAWHPRPFDLGVGAMAGRPGGLTLRLYLVPRRELPQYAVDVLLGSDLDEVTFVDLRLASERPLPESPLHAVVGAGVVVGNDGTLGPQNAIFGLSTLVGVNFFAERFEVFLQLSPRLRLRPSLNGTFDGGVGLRYYL
jgi:hypothetical protein